jgi:hypothetical protein
MQPEQEAVEISPQDRRNDFRHAFERACRVTPANTPQLEVVGLTTNVSRSGMLVKLPRAAFPAGMPKVGEFARVCIDLPSSGGFPPRSLECSARVVRIEPGETDQQEVAFEVLNMKMVTSRSSRASRRKQTETVVH